MIYALLSLIHICRDLRAFGGTSLDPNFLVGGPKSIYRAGPPPSTFRNYFSGAVETRCCSFSAVVERASFAINSAKTDTSEQGLLNKFW